MPGKERLYVYNQVVYLWPAWQYGMTGYFSPVNWGGDPVWDFSQAVKGAVIRRIRPGVDENMNKTKTWGGIGHNFASRNATSEHHGNNDRDSSKESILRNYTM